MIRSSLRRRAATMGTLAAAGAGALTAGLVSGIGHLAADTAAGTTTKTTGNTGTAPAGKTGPAARTPAAATSTPSRTKRHRTTSTRTRTSANTGGGNVAPAPPNSPPQGGSNGS